MQRPNKILTPEQIQAIEGMKACEIELIKLLQKYNCRLSMRDVMIDGRTVERMIMPLPIGIDPAWMWNQFDAEKGRVEGMMLDDQKPPR